MVLVRLAMSGKRAGSLVRTGRTRRASALAEVASV